MTKIATIQTSDENDHYKNNMMRITSLKTQLIDDTCG